MVRALITASNADGSVAAPSAPSPVIQADPPISVAAPAVLGTPSLGATLSTDNGSWTPIGDNITYGYAWQRGDAINGYSTIPGATAATYTTVSADVGESIRVVVTATNVDGSVSATSTVTQAVQPPPGNTIAPASPTGTFMNGYILTPDNGTWDSPATYAYSWVRCPGTATSVTAACTPVSTRATYALTVPDIGTKIAVIVTATSIGGSTSATSALTPLITGQPLTPVTPPSISGNPQPPNTLYANPGTWSVTPTGVDYDWDRCDADGVSNCTLIAADTAHYTLSAPDDGHTIVLIANVSSPGRVATAQSAPLVVQDQPLPQATVLPTVTGTTVRTNVMGASGGVWTNSPRTLTYQWERCNAASHNCLAIPGATQPTYQLTNVDEASTITIAVSATNTSGTTTAMAAPSGVVTALPPVSTGRPALSTLGVQQSVPVTVTNGTWQATGPSTYTTVWQRCNSSGAACAPISGATTASYTPTAADVGHTLAVIVTATNVDGSIASASAPSDVVLPAAPRWRDLPVLSATNGYVGGVLSVTNGVFTGPAVTSDVTQIMRCTNACTPISTASSYTIVTADIGAILRVRETASNAGGTAVVWSAQYVGPVASSASASVVLGVGQAVLRNKDGDPLATAQLSSGANASADFLVAHAAQAAAAARKSAVVTRVITVRRAAKVHGPLRAWVCAAAITRGSAPAACTRQVTIRGASAQAQAPRDDHRQGPGRRRPPRPLALARALGRGALLAPVARRRHAELAFERLAERVLRAVADAARDRVDGGVGGLQQPSGDGHPPPRQVGERRLAGQLGEAPGERRARQSGLRGQRGDRPRLGRTVLDRAQRSAHRRVAQRLRPAARGLRPLEPRPHRVEQQQVEQRRQGRGEPGTLPVHLGPEQLDHRADRRRGADPCREVHDVGQALEERMRARPAQVVGPADEHRARRALVQRRAVGRPVVGVAVDVADRIGAQLEQRRGGVVGESVRPTATHERHVPGGHGDRLAVARGQEPRGSLEDHVHAGGAGGGEAQAPRRGQERPGRLGTAGAHGADRLSHQIHHHRPP